MHQLPQKDYVACVLMLCVKYQFTYLLQCLLYCIRFFLSTCID